MGSDERNYYSVTTSSPFSLSSSTSETTIMTITPTQYMHSRGVWLDLSNLTQNATIRVKYEINNDGTYYTFDTINFSASSDNKAVLVAQKVPAQYDIRITIQSQVAEGASRNIYFERWYADLSNQDA